MCVCVCVCVCLLLSGHRHNLILFETAVNVSEKIPGIDVFLY
jgi:hypothetical protein